MSASLTRYKPLSRGDRVINKTANETLDSALFSSRGASSRERAKRETRRVYLEDTRTRAHAFVAPRVFRVSSCKFKRNQLQRGCTMRTIPLRMESPTRVEFPPRDFPRFLSRARIFATRGRRVQRNIADSFIEGFSLSKWQELATGISEVSCADFDKFFFFDFQDPFQRERGKWNFRQKRV